MQINQLLELLLSRGPLPEKLTDETFIGEIKAFTSPLLQVTSYDRDQLILSAGHRADHIYFCDRGLAYGHYPAPETKKEVVHFLWGKDAIITAPESFFQRKPSQLFITAVSGTILTSISYYDLQACFARFPETEIFARNVILQYAVCERKRSYDMEHVPAWDRYLKLLKRLPDIEQLVPQRVIVSWLNITPQSLSRLKNKRMRG